MNSPICRNLLILTLAASAQSAFAATSTWLQTAAGSYNWTDAANWSGDGVPNAVGAVVNLNNDVGAGLQTITLDQDVTLGTLNIGDTGASTVGYFTIQGARTLTFSAAAGAAAALNVSTVAVTGTAVISTPISLASDLVVTNNGTQNISLNGAISTNARTLTFDTSSVIGVKAAIAGTGAIVKNGKGTVNYQGISSNTGAMVINSGGLIVTGGATTGSIANTDITVNANAQTGVAQGGSYLEIGSSVAGMATGRVADTAVVTLKGGGLSYKGSNTAGTTSETIGGIVAGAGNSNITLSGVSSTTQGELSVSTLTRDSRGTLQVRGSSLGGAYGTMNTTRLTVATAPTLTGGGGAAGTKTISIIPWMIGGTNVSNENYDLMTYDATLGLRPLAAAEYATSLTSLGGTENVSYNGNVTANTTVNAYKNTSYSANTITAGFTLNITSGALVFSNNNGGFNNGTVNFGSAEGVIWSGGVNTNTIGSVIAGSNGFTKAGTGTLTISGANTYTGQTTVSGGVLKMGAANTLSANSAVSLANSTVNTLLAAATSVTTALDLNGYNQTVGSLSGGGAFGGNVLLGGATLATGGDNTSTAYGGVISGAGSLTKKGTGTFTLTGTSTYTGTTTVEGGKLAVSGALNGAGGVTVGSVGELNVTGSIAGAVALNGKISGSGSVGAVTAAGGVIAPGQDSVATLKTQAVSLDAASTLDIELGHGGSGAVSDQVDVTGAVSLAIGANLKLSLSTGVASAAVGDLFFIVVNDLNDAVDGVFTRLNGDNANLSQGSQFSWDSKEWSISYTGDIGSSSFAGAGNDIVLQVVAVPEPGTWVMLVGGFASLLWFQRGKRRAAV